MKKIISTVVNYQEKITPEKRVRAMNITRQSKMVSNFFASLKKQESCDSQ